MGQTAEVCVRGVNPNHRPFSSLVLDDPVGGGISYERQAAEDGSRRLLEAIQAYLAKHQPEARR
jgi:hypothetical protein